MRTFGVIIVGSVTLLSLSVVIGHNESRIGAGISAYQSASGSSSILGSSWTSKQDIGANCTDDDDDHVRARSGDKTKRRKDQLRGRGRDKERGVNAEIKRVGKNDPLTRQAKRYKGPGADRRRPRHRSHERRNLEKQYLVRNRTLELLERRASVNARDVLFGRRKTVGGSGGRLGLRITDLLMPESKLKTIAFNEASRKSSHYDDVFEDPSVSPWVNPPKSEPRRGDEERLLDEGLLKSVYMPVDERIDLHRGLATLLSRLLQTLTNNTDYENQELLQELDFDNSVQGDLCQKWLDCKEKLEEAFLGPLVLPACPCHYPSSIFYDDKIWDEVQERHFRWRDVSGEAERLDVYKPGATYCIRSLLAQGGGSAAAQHCCYDPRRRLITRGSGAGTPNLVSPEVSTVLHERIDILPWRLCKGDFSRFNKVRPPNNGNNCPGNPEDEEYQRQIDDTKHY